MVAGSWFSFRPTYHIETPCFEPGLRENYDVSPHLFVQLLAEVPRPLSN